MDALLVAKGALEQNLIRALLVDHLSEQRSAQLVDLRIATFGEELTSQTPSARNEARKSGSAAGSALSRSN